MAKQKSNPNEKLRIEKTIVFNWNLEAYQNKKRFIINQGGSRSSKTYSICQLLIYLAMQEKLVISVVRKTLPDLKGSVMKDFFEILKELNLYDETFHNKTENTYVFANTGSEIQFYGLDNEQKMRGRKRDIAYLNEANELSDEEFRQLNLRTSKAMFIDFNPSDSEHFLYDLINDEESILIKSTYKDNTFLSDSQIKVIEDLIKTDINAYRIYALGERPINQTRIYSHFQKYVDEPEFNDWCYGLDFGFNHPTALVKIMYSGNQVFIKQLIYESKLTTPDIIEKMNTLLSDADRAKPIYCDYSRPEVIEELKKAGFNAKIANKLVKDGIDYVKSTEVYVHLDSLDIWREYKLYAYKSVGDVISEEPIKENDDALDAIRYALYTRKKRNNSKGNFEIIFI